MITTDVAEPILSSVENYGLWSKVRSQEIVSHYFVRVFPPYTLLCILRQRMSFAKLAT